jgi:hypothetical protein
LVDIFEVQDIGDEVIANTLDSILDIVTGGIGSRSSEDTSFLKREGSELKIFGDS